MRFVPLGILVVGSVLLLISSGQSVAHGDSGHEYVTFRGPITTALDQTNLVSSGGGTITVTLTADLQYLARADVSGFETNALVGGQVVTLRFARELYFDPPVVLADGSFEVALPGLLAGMIRDSVHIQGHLESSAAMTGTAQWGYFSGPSVPSPSWAATASVDMPPGVDDIAHLASFRDHAGGLAYTTNANGDITSVALKVAGLEPCFPSGRPFNMRFYFETPIEPGDGFHAYISDVSLGLLPLVGRNITSEDGATSGDMTIARGLYGDDCRVTLHWSTLAATAAPTTLPSDAPSLPSTGGGPDGRARMPVALLAVAGAVLAALAVAMRRRPG